MAKPRPFIIHQARLRAPLVLTCEHAGHLFERADRLGLGEADAKRHIAWDIGAYAVAKRLSDMLRAPLVAQLYSRLVIDCNRQMAAPDLIPRLADGAAIPGNIGIPTEERTRRIAMYHAPYHAAVATLLARLSGRHPVALISIHSFTPSLNGQLRPWEIGLCYQPGTRLGMALAARLSREPSSCIGDNMPYGLDAASDGILPLHKPDGENAVLIELRQDLVSDQVGQARIAQRLAEAIRRAVDCFD